MPARLPWNLSLTSSLKVTGPHLSRNPPSGQVIQQVFPKPRAYDCEASGGTECPFVRICGVTIM
jgi:hypothetical protein